MKKGIFRRFQIELSDCRKNYHNENMVPGDLHWNQALHVPITYRENNLNLQDQEPLEVTGKLLFSQDSI